MPLWRSQIPFDHADSAAGVFRIMLNFSAKSIKSWFINSPSRCHWWRLADWTKFSGRRRSDRSACLSRCTWTRGDLEKSLSPICHEWRTWRAADDSVLVEEGWSFLLSVFSSAQKCPQHPPQSRGLAPRTWKEWRAPQTHPRWRSPNGRQQTHFVAVNKSLILDLTSKDNNSPPDQSRVQLWCSLAAWGGCRGREQFVESPHRNRPMYPLVRGNYKMVFGKENQGVTPQWHFSHRWWGCSAFPTSQPKVSRARL